MKCYLIYYILYIAWWTCDWVTISQANRTCVKNIRVFGARFLCEQSRWKNASNLHALANSFNYCFNEQLRDRKCLLRLRLFDLAVSWLRPLHPIVRQVSLLSNCLLICISTIPIYLDFRLFLFSLALSLSFYLLIFIYYSYFTFVSSIYSLNLW